MTPASAAWYRDEVREEALVLLSLELSGVHLGIWKGLKCFPGFSSVRISGELRRSTRSLFSLWFYMHKYLKAGYLLAHLKVPTLGKCSSQGTSWSPN